MAQFNRLNYFEGVGTQVDRCFSSEEVLRQSGLDYRVVREPIYRKNGELVKDQYLNIKEGTGTQLGVVGKRYNIIQNQEAFKFMNDMVKMGLKFETAGSHKNFSQSFIVGKTDDMKILDDIYSPYMLFTNSFDGSGCVRVIFTPIRLLCLNAIVAALKEAKFVISIRHNRNADYRLAAAKKTIASHTVYMDNLKTKTEEWATTRFSRQEFDNIVIPELIKKQKLDKDDKTEQAEEFRDDILKLYDATDLGNYDNSAFKAIHTMADYETHIESKRDTSNPMFNMQKVMKGMILLNTVVKVIQNSIPLKLHY